jgi:hypothetical protein
MPSRLVSVLLLSALGILPAAPARGAEPVDGVFSAGGLSGAYRLVVPDALAASDRMGLLVFFHADGDVDSVASHADGLLERGAKSQLAVSALAVPHAGPADPPPSDPAELCWWAPRAQSNAEYVGAWIESVALGELGDRLDFGRIYFAGVSGGGDFASELNLHLGFRYGGGAVALCGGDLPRADGGSCVSDPGPSVVDPLPAVADLPPGAAASFVYSFDLTADDSLRPQALAARDYYEGLGFSVLFGKPAGSGHCGFEVPLEELLDRRIEHVASLVPPSGCSDLDLSLTAAALVDAVPLEVADQAIPAGDAERATLLAAIQAELDAILALRAEIPDAVDLCPARSDCPRLELRDVKREIRKHLARLKRRLVRKALARSDDPALRASLRETSRASHAQKKAALRAIPNHARLCGA